MSSPKPSTAPDWAGRHPFPPDQKRAVALRTTSIPRIYGHHPHRIPTWMHVSTDLITHAEFVLAAGVHFEPADIHAGDEVYYVVSGSAWVHQPATGQVVSLDQNDVLHIPRGAPHVSHNFGREDARILTFFAPRIWAAPEDRLQLSDQLPGLVATPGRGGWNGMGPNAPAPPVAPFSELGRYPVDGPWSRTHGVLTPVPMEKTKLILHGRDEQALLRVYVDNDFMMVATMTLCPGAQSDVETHAGDEVVHVLCGGISVEVEPDTRTGVSVPRLELKEGEKGLLPKGVAHRYLNFDPTPAACAFAVAPQYGWGDNRTE